MAKWTFEPGHTAAEFCARHMMVTYVRGHFKDVHGTLNFDVENPAGGLACDPRLSKWPGLLFSASPFKGNGFSR